MTNVVDEPLTVLDDAAAATAARARRRRRWVLLGTWLGLVGMVVAGLVLLALLPTRSFLGQRAQIRDAEKRLAEMRVVNDRLQQRVNALSTPAEVDLTARAQFSLVKPGEAAYSLLPLPKITIGALPPQWPFSVIQQVAAVRR